MAVPVISCLRTSSHGNTFYLFGIWYFILLLVWSWTMAFVLWFVNSCQEEWSDTLTVHSTHVQYMERFEDMCYRKTEGPKTELIDVRSTRLYLVCSIDQTSICWYHLVRTESGHTDRGCLHITSSCTEGGCTRIKMRWNKKGKIYSLKSFTPKNFIFDDCHKN